MKLAMRSHQLELAIRQEVVQLMPMFVSPTPVFFNDAYNDERVDATTMELVKKLNLRAVGCPASASR